MTPNLFHLEMEDFLRKRKKSLDPYIMTSFLDNFTPVNVFVLVKIFKRYGMTTTIYTRLVNIVEVWSDNQTDIYLQDNIMHISGLIILISRHYKEEYKSLIPKIGILKFMVLNEYYPTAMEIWNGLLACTHLLLFCSLKELNDYRNSLANILHRLLAIPIDKTTSRIIVNLIKLANTWHNYHNHLKFLSNLDLFNINALSRDINFDKVIALLLEQQQYQVMPRCMTHLFIYCLSKDTHISNSLSVITHRRFSKEHATTISELLVRSNVLSYFNSLDMNSNLSTWKSFLILFANLTHSQLGSSLVFNLLPKILQDSSFILEGDIINHGDIILALTSIWKRLIKYGRNRVDPLHLENILSQLHIIMLWMIDNIVLNVARQPLLDKFLKHVFLNIVDAFKCIKNANINLINSKSFDLLGMVMRHRNNPELRQKRIKFASKHLFEILMMHCTSADKLAVFISNQDNILGLIAYLQDAKISNLVFLKRFLMLMTSTGIPIISNSNLFVVLINDFNMNSHDIFGYLQDHVFIEIKDFTILQVLHKNRNNAGVMTSLMIMTFKTHFNLIANLPNCKEWLGTELSKHFEKNNQIALLLELIFKSHEIPLVDEYDSIDMSRFKSDNSALKEISPELVFAETLGKAELFELCLYCDAYDLYDEGVMCSQWLLHKIEIEDLFEILFELKSYNPLLVDLSTCFGYLFNEILKIWMKNMTFVDEMYSKFMGDVPKEKLRNQMVEIIMQKIQLSSK